METASIDLSSSTFRKSVNFAARLPEAFSRSRERSANTDSSTPHSAAISTLRIFGYAST